MQQIAVTIIATVNDFILQNEIKIERKDLCIEQCAGSPKSTKAPK